MFVDITVVNDILYDTAASPAKLFAYGQHYMQMQFHPSIGTGLQKNYDAYETVYPRNRYWQFYSSTFTRKPI